MPFDVYRFEAQGASTALAGDQVNFDCPSMIYDLSTVKLFFQVTINGTPGKQSLSRDTDSLIKHLEVWIDDTCIQRIENYNQISRIYNDYKQTSDQLSAGSLYANSLPISNVVNTGTSACYTYSNLPCCIDRFLGILGSKNVVRGKLKILFELAPNNTVFSTGSPPSYALSDVHLTCSPGKLEQLSREIVFDNFRSSLQYNRSFMQNIQNTLSVRHVDYVIGTFLMPDFQTNVSNTPINGTSYYFQHGTGTTMNADFNFLINGCPVFSRNPQYALGIEYLGDVLSNHSTPTCMLNRDGSISLNTLAQTINSSWATGAKVDTSGPVIVSFNTWSADSRSNVANYSFLIIKCDSLLTLNADGTYNFTE